MAIYTISITVPKAAAINIVQLVQLLKETAYTREVRLSSGVISSDYKSIKWNIEGTISFHDISSFVNTITKNMQETYSYSITCQKPGSIFLN